MSNKKSMIGVIILFGLFIYLFFCFALDAQRIQTFAKDLRGKAASAKQPYHLILIEQEQSHPYWQMIEQGALDSAKQIGMEIEYTGPVRYSLEEQIKLLEKAIAANVDGIIVQGLNDSAFTPIINKAIEKGIPVITIDTDAPTSKRLTYVGTDNLEAGKELGTMVATAMNGHGKVGVIIGSDTAENQLLRIKGFKSVIDNYPGMEVLDVRSSNISRIQAIRQAEDMLQKYPEMDTIVGTSALDGVGALQAKQSLGRQEVKIFGFDNLPETLDRVKDGSIQATLSQRPYLMGYDAVRLMKDYFQGKPLPKNSYTSVEVIDRSNGN